MTLHFRLEFAAAVSNRHGREGVLTIHRIANSTVSEETSYSCGSLTFMKASIASSDSSPVFFVPGDNDSVSLTPHFHVDFSAGHARQAIPSIYPPAENTGHGDVLLRQSVVHMCGGV